MRRLSFYPKLALGNLWRNRTTYIPYLLASVTCIITFYSLLAIKASGSLNQLRGATIVESFIAIGIILLGVFCAILLLWTNSFLIKRRKKELALYSVLGMEKRNIAVLMFFETLFIAAVALVLGLAGGMLLSRVLYLVLQRLTQYEVLISLPISFRAMGAATGYFAGVFGLCLLLNLRQVRLANPVEMMAGAKQGEKEPKASVVLTILGILLVGGGYFIALKMQEPLLAILTFLGAALMVILGTYCLFTSGSIAFLKLLRRNKNYYYRPNHFISVSGMMYRMKQNAAGLATICILSCMVLVTVASTVGLYSNLDYTVETLYPNDFTIRTYFEEDRDKAQAMALAYAEEYGVDVQDAKTYRFYYTMALGSGDVLESYGYGYGTMQQDTDLYFTTQAEYQKNEGIALQLQDGEAGIYTWNGDSPASGSLTIDGIPYRLRELDSMTGISNNSMSTSYHMLVLPDEAAFGTMLEASSARLEEANAAVPNLRWEYTYTVVGSGEARTAYRLGLEQAKLEEDWDGHSVNFSPRDEMQEYFQQMNGGFMFLGCFFGVLFLLAASMIIYYKQLSEGYDDAARFAILQKVGMSEKEVRRTIQSQVRSVFFLPLLVAVVHICVAFVPIRSAMTLFGVPNVPLLLASFGITVLVYTLVYLFVYRRTAKTYFHIVRGGA